MQNHDEWNNVAFKFNYNDGGKGRESFGFRGRCSASVTNYNTARSGNWCSHEKCPCISGQPNEYPCGESRLLLDWMPNAEYDYDMENDRFVPRRIPLRFGKGLQGNIAMLTTIQPQMTERDRIIFGVFLISEHFVGDDKDGHHAGYVKADNTLRMELKPREPLYFWKYYYNREKPETCKWGQGLIRYISDMVVCQILQDIVSLKQEEEKVIAEKLLEISCDNANIDVAQIPQPAGLRN